MARAVVVVQCNGTLSLGRLPSALLMPNCSYVYSVSQAWSFVCLPISTPFDYLSSSAPPTLRNWPVRRSQTCRSAAAAYRSDRLPVATSAAVILLVSAQMTLLALALAPPPLRPSADRRPGSLAGTYLSLAHLLLWVSFALSAAVGYVAYGMRVYDLEGKLDGVWARGLDTQARGRIQDLESCCGWYRYVRWRGSKKKGH